jgi:hypothetical protein
MEDLEKSDSIQQTDFASVMSVIYEAMEHGISIPDNADNTSNIKFELPTHEEVLLVFNELSTEFNN